MLAQVTLTPAESKKLIAKAVARMPAVQRAFDRGIVALCPSSSTYFVVEEITGKKPGTPVWLCGMVVPKGTCSEAGLPIGGRSELKAGEVARYDPMGFRHTIVIRNGVVSQGVPAPEILEEMGPEDVYIKGGNALDVEGNVGILSGAASGVGSIGVVMTAAAKKHFQVIVAIGLEKLIPVPVAVAAKAARASELSLGMGIPCKLYPCRGVKVVTEIKAFEMLSGATAIPISAGGLGGAEGAITLVLEGDDTAVKAGFEFAEQSKGARLPEVRMRNCLACESPTCRFPVGDKPWVVW